MTAVKAKSCGAMEEHIDNFRQVYAIWGETIRLLKTGPGTQGAIKRRVSRIESLLGEILNEMKDLSVELEKPYIPTMGEIMAEKMGRKS